MSTNEHRYRDVDEALEERLAQLPEAMREALREQRPELAAELAQSYLDATPAGRLDMAAFFESEGPRQLHEVKSRLEDGTPTSADIGGWLRGEPTLPSVAPEA